MILSALLGLFPRFVYLWRLMPRGPALLALSAGILALRSAAADGVNLPAVDDKWRHFKSPNFELFSRLDEASSRQFLYNMELLRGLFGDRLKMTERSRLEVSIYAFRTADDFRAYASEDIRKNDRIAGFYQAGPDRAIISLSPAEGEDASRRLIFHEYVHHLFRATGEEPTAWFNEGMAELLAGIQVTGGGVEIGHPLVGRIIALQEEKLLPLEAIFEAGPDSPYYRSKDHSGMFYAESWALLHYWYFGQSKIPEASVKRFLRVASDSKLSKKVNLRALFRECFAMDYPDMVRQLERYVSSGSYRWGKQPIPAIQPAASYTMRAMPREEIQLRLAELMLRTNPTPMAKFALVDAGTKTPANARALEALGAAALLEQDAPLAQERWEAAVAAGSMNSAVLRELALLEGRQWFEHFDFDFRFPADRAEHLRERLTRSITAEPQQTPAYEMLIWLEAYAQEPVMANINVVQRAFSALPHRDRVLVALALVRIRVGQVEEGKKLLATLDQLDPDLWARQAAETILARLEGRPPQQVSEKNANATTVSLNATSKMVKVPSVELPPKP